LLSEKIIQGALALFVIGVCSIEIRGGTATGVVSSHLSTTIRTVPLTVIVVIVVVVVVAEVFESVVIVIEVPAIASRTVYISNGPRGSQSQLYATPRGVESWVIAGLSQGRSSVTGAINTVTGRGERDASRTRDASGSSVSRSIALLHH
jgi:hypothetical protein